MSDIVKFLRKRNKKGKDELDEIRFLESQEGPFSFSIASSFLESAPSFSPSQNPKGSESPLTVSKLELPTLTTSAELKKGISVDWELKGLSTRSYILGWHVTRSSALTEQGVPYLKYSPDFTRPFEHLQDKGLRALILGASGFGKSTLARVIVEETWEKDEERQIFIVDTSERGEYLSFALPQRIEELIDRLSVLDLEPKTYPVRILLPPFIDKDMITLPHAEYEVSHLKIDPRYLTIEVLRSLIFVRRQSAGEALLMDALRDFRQQHGKTWAEFLASLHTVASGYYERTVPFILKKIESLEKWSGEIDVSEIMGERKINVFWLPPSLVPGEDERRAWVFYLVSMLKNFLTQFPSLFVLEEALELVRSIGTTLTTRTALGTLATRGRKKQIDQIYISQVSTIIREVLENMNISFFFNLRTVLDTREYRKIGLLSEGERADVVSLPRYMCIVKRRGGAGNILAVRPTKSYLPRPA